LVYLRRKIMGKHNVAVLLLTSLMIVQTALFPALLSGNIVPSEIFSGVENDAYLSQPQNAVGPMGAEREPITIALIGTDERETEKSRSDVIVLGKYNPEQNSLIIISIPRDAMVDIPGRGKAKINAAYAYGGADLLLQTLEHLFSLEVPYYAHVNFRGFVAMVDAIGGVRVNAKKDFYEHWRDNDVYIKKGENILDGEHLLEYVRFRHDADGDFGRIARQQEVISCIARQFITPEYIFKVPSVLKAARENIDTNINWMDLFRILSRVNNTNNLQIETYVLQTHSKIIDGIWYQIIDNENLKLLAQKLKNI
jgi:LCP family protein required for cell wall assembly